MSIDNRKLLAKRIGEYAYKNQLQSCLVVFHGGEPLLAGKQRIIESARWIKEAVPINTQIDFSVQTNGVLLNDSIIEDFSKEKIAISLSLDGPREAHDLHRLNHKGHSSYDAVLKAYNLLKYKPDIFAGVIAVIDTRISPQKILDFFADLNPPSLDFLLPDSNYLSPPPLRDQNSKIYQQWLIEAFDLWYERYAHIPIRTFDALIGCLLGYPSTTDAFGFGDVNLLNIETDGSYHDLDVLKITETGRSSLHKSLKDSTIDEAACSSKIAEHRTLLRFTGLSEICQACSVVDVCGGGSVPHRFSKEGFKNPTVYCLEMKTLIKHIQHKLNSQLSPLTTLSSNSSDSEIQPYIFSEQTIHLSHNRKILEVWQNKMLDEFTIMLKEFCNKFYQYKAEVHSILQKTCDEITFLSHQPSVRLWLHVFNKTLQNRDFINSCGDKIEFEPSYIKYIKNIEFKPKNINFHKDDQWLRLPFKSYTSNGSDIEFESADTLLSVQPVVNQAFRIIQDWNPSLFEEIFEMVSEIQFIRDKNFPKRIVSFSDNITPGALYISVKTENHILNPYQIADSIIHEYRHQKLYILDDCSPLILRDKPLIVSPWRQDLRPPSGLFHAMFVFTTLLSFWKYVAQYSTKGITEIPDASQEVFSIHQKLIQGYEILGTCSLTPLGRSFLPIFKDHILNTNSFH